jgi:hypothetical protein
MCDTNIKYHHRPHYLNNQDKPSQSGVISEGVSDHFITLGTRNVLRWPWVMKWCLKSSNLFQRTTLYITRMKYIMHSEFIIITLLTHLIPNVTTCPYPPHTHYLNNQDKPSQSGVISEGVSDHFITLGTRKSQ